MSFPCAPRDVSVHHPQKACKRFQKVYENYGNLPVGYLKPLFFNKVAIEKSMKSFAVFALPLLAECLFPVTANTAGHIENIGIDKSVEKVG